MARAVFLLLMVSGVLAGETYLVWVSVDGFRHDYLERADTPVLDRLVREGAVTRALVPTFPTLTFPSHVSQATGALPGRHGVLSNTFFDRSRGRTYSFPPFPWLLQAEPIWTTAQRQGVRTAVLDWPLSHRQQGPYRAEVHNMRYDGSLSDEDRLEALLAAWRADEGAAPLRLLMGYGDALDKAGHAHGPDAPEIALEVEALDERLGRFLESLQDLFAERAGPEDSLYLFLTTDHGMSAVHTAVNVDLLTGLEDREDVLILTAGNLAQVYLHDVRGRRRRRALIRTVRRRVRGLDFVTAYTQETLPAAWGFRHAERGGDLVLFLAPGYVFNRRAREMTVPAADARAVLGAHGYHPKDDPDQLGFAVFWRRPEPLGGIELGAVDALRLHATAAKILGIDPAPGAEQRVIDLWPALVP